MIDLPIVGRFYDLVKLITTRLEHPFEDSQKSFAQDVDLDTELTIEEIQNVLFQSKKLSTFNKDALLKNDSQSAAAESEKTAIDVEPLNDTKFSESVQPQTQYADVFDNFKSKLDIVLSEKDEVETKHCIRCINKFFDCIHPYIESFSQTGYTSLLYALLSYVKYSNTSSIAQKDLSTELSDYRNSYDILTKVPLIDHMLDVLEMTAKQIAQTPGMTSMYEGMLVVGVFHDIGKINEYIKQYITEKESYSMIDHALISAEFLRKLYLNLNDEPPVEYIEAIQFHHKPESDCPKKNMYFKTLKLADHSAREREILENIDKLPSITQLFDKEKLIDVIFQMFDVDYSNRLSMPDIFCLKGYLFVHEGKLKDNIAKYLSRNKKLCKEQKLNDNSYLSAIKSMLEAYSLVSAERRNKFPVLVFKSTSTRTRNEKKLLNFIAISLEVFNSITSSFPKAPPEFNSVEAIEFKKYFEAS